MGSAPEANHMSDCVEELIGLLMPASAQRLNGEWRTKFVRSILRQAKRSSWQLSPKPSANIRGLFAQEKDWKSPNLYDDTDVIQSR